MADKKKTSDKQGLPLDQVQDAVIVDDQSLTDPKTADPNDLSPDAQDTSDVTPDAPDQPLAGPEPSDTPDTAPDQMIPDQTTPEQEAADQAPLPEDAASATHPQSDSQQVAPPPPPVVVRKGGFVPMFLGGVAAAAIGFGIARSGVLDNIIPPPAGPEQAVTAQDLDAVTQQVTQQTATVSDLGERLSALENAPAARAETDDITADLDDLGQQIAGLAQRIDALEDRPVGAAQNIDSDALAGLDAARAELEELRQTLVAQQSEIAALAESAAREEEAAQLSATRALQRAAMTRVQVALDSGTGYADALADLQATEIAVPTGLADQAETGVPTLSGLQTTFPDLAREALLAARQDAGAAGLTGFVQTQLGLRSLAPREGSDPDAVLSRAEAALRGGDLGGTLTELDALPAAATAVLAEWRAQAETRLAVIAAAQDMSQSLNTN